MSGSELTQLESGFGLGGYIPRGIEAEAGQKLPTSDDQDKAWMRLALLEAMEGIGRSSPNPSVGAVIVKDGQLIAKAATEAYGSYHAEVMALKRAEGHNLKGATCYVTLEPCGGHGKQGPCAEALIHAGISRVVIAASDPHAKASGLGLKRLREASVQVDIGCMEAEAKAWHFPFLAYESKKSPIIVGKWAQTLDGHLADDNGHSQWISGRRSRAYTHWLRQKYDAIMVGAQTVLSDSPRLTARDSAAPIVRHPHKIIYDPSARLWEASDEALTALLTETEKADGPLIFWCVDAREKRGMPKFLESFSDVLIRIPILDSEDWTELFLSISAELQHRRGKLLQSVMVEGGSQLLTLLMRADKLDATHIFLRAGFLGGVRHRIARLHRGENPELSIMERHDFKLLAAQQIDDDIVLECINRRLDLWK